MTKRAWRIFRRCRRARTPRPSPAFSCCAPRTYAGPRWRPRCSPGGPPHPEVISVMASYGIETAAHRSRVACAADLALATVVLAMSRENLRYAVTTAPAAWPRAFTLKELIRRGEQIGPRPPDEPFSGWLARAHAGRERMALLGDSAEDDVADPAGGPRRAYADTARLLERLVTRLAELGWAHTRPGPLPRRPRIRPVR